MTTDTTSSPARPLTVSEVADRLGVREKYVRRMLQERRLPFLKIGHLVRVLPEAVDDYMLSSTIVPSSPQTRLMFSETARTASP